MDFKDFDIIHEMKDAHDSAGIITAKRRLGKSVLMKDLCYQMKKAGWVDDAYVFSSTAHLQPDLFDYVPEDHIYNGLDQVKLKELWTNQEKKVTALMKSGIKKDDILCTLVLFDDCSSDTKGCRYSDILTSFFTAGRHLRFTQIFIQQYINSVPPTIRSNIDWFACFKINRETDRNTIIESYIDLPKKDALQILKDITAKPDSYQCMIINLVVNGTDPTTYIRKYTASMKVPKFMFESKEPSGPVFKKSVVNDVQETHKGYRWLL